MVCPAFYSLIISMLVDEERKYVLTKFSKYKGVNKVVKSDHNVLILEVKCPWMNNLRKQRVEIFNLRNRDCQRNFFDDTNKHIF